MKKIRVLQFPLANAYGGITQYVLQNWKFIDRDRFQFDFATMARTKLHFEDEVVSQGCNVFHISCYAEENERKFEQEVRQILSEGYDAVHLHTSFWKSFKVEEIARDTGIPKIIVHSHNTNVLSTSNREEEYNLHKACLERLDESVATDFWACSDKAAEWLFGDRIPKEKIVIQKNAIDVERFRFDETAARQVRRELGWENQFIIGHVGRFSYQKNHEFLLRVFREMHQKDANTKLLLVGVGPEEERIKAMIADWNLESEVVILERRNDVHRLMQAMDVFVLPSRFEGLPIVLIEAQASGCPCLAADTISEEVLLTDNIHLLPLKEEQWISELLKMSRSENLRTQDNADILRSKGYDLPDQIKNIEGGYSKEVTCRSSH